MVLPFRKNPAIKKALIASNQQDVLRKDGNYFYDDGDDVVYNLYGMIFYHI